METTDKLNIITSHQLLSEAEFPGRGELRAFTSSFSFIFFSPLGGPVCQRLVCGSAQRLWILTRLGHATMTRKTSPACSPPDQLFSSALPVVTGIGVEVGTRGCRSGKLGRGRAVIKIQGSAPAPATAGPAPAPAATATQLGQPGTVGLGHHCNSPVSSNPVFQAEGANGFANATRCC